MPVLYAVKHVFRSWKLFLALLIGITLASAFFAGIDIKANVTAGQALKQELSGVYVDMVADVYQKPPEDVLNASRDVAGARAGPARSAVMNTWRRGKIFRELETV